MVATPPRHYNSLRYRTTCTFLSTVKENIMPSMPPTPYQSLPQSRFDKFMERNIVVVSICGGLALVALIAAIVAVAH